MTDFEYERCLDKRGRFNAMKAKKYLKEMGISEDTLEFIKEHKRLPSEEDEVGPEPEEDEPEVLYEAINFDYTQCVNDKGQFRVGITKVYLKEMGIAEGAVDYIGENIPSPKEMMELMEPPEPEPEAVEGLKEPPVDYTVEKAIVAAVIPKPAVVDVATNIAVGAGAAEMEKMVAEKADPARAAVGYKNECWIGSKQCRMCGHLEQEGKASRELVDGKKVDIEGALDPVPLTEEVLRVENHTCEENSWKVALIGTCDKHVMRG